MMVKMTLPLLKQGCLELTSLQRRETDGGRSWSIGQVIKQQREVQSEAAGNEPGHADCGRRRTGADRKDSCVGHDSVHAVLASSQRVRGCAQLRPARGVCGALLGF